MMNETSQTQSKSQVEPVITKKDLFKSWFTWFNFNTAGWNWERMQHIAFALSMVPILKKLYPQDKEKYKDRLVSHMKFFNSEPQSSTVIHGITVALEEQKAKGENIPDDTVDSVKAGMMGPLAGIGDSMIAALLNTLLLSIGLGLAFDGNIFGPIFFFVSYVGIVTLGSWWIFRKGYQLGVSSISTMIDSGTVNKFTEAMTILGLTVIGGLTATYVGLSTAIVFEGKTTIEIQGILDGILPKLLPLLLTIGIYYLITKKNISTVKVMLFIFIGGFILSVSGII